MEEVKKKKVGVGRKKVPAGDKKKAIQLYVKAKHYKKVYAQCEKIVNEHNLL